MNGSSRLGLAGSLLNVDPRDQWAAADNFDVDHQAYTQIKKTLIRLGRLGPPHTDVNLWMPVQGDGGRVQILIRNVNEISQFWKWGELHQPATAEMTAVLRTGKRRHDRRTKWVRFDSCPSLEQPRRRRWVCGSCQPARTTTHVERQMKLLLTAVLLASSSFAQVYSPTVLLRGQPDSTNLKKFANTIVQNAGAKISARNGRSNLAVLPDGWPVR